MPGPSNDVTRRVLHILHWGFVETRNLALGDNQQQIHDLADAMETLPEELKAWREDSLEAIHSNLETYENKYRGRCFEYLKYLHAKQPDPAGRF